MSMDVNLVDPRPRLLGDTAVGPLGFGCWRLTDDRLDATRCLLAAALDSGLNLVDIADVYGLDWGGSGFGSCEERLGEVLSTSPGMRDRMVLATKGGIWPGRPYDSSHGYITAACESSLRRLRVDHLDLYQIHRPDQFTHPAALAETLQSLIDRGLTRMVGVSNYSSTQTAALQAHLATPLVSTQPELSLTQLGPLRDGTLDAAMAAGTTVLAWSPLAGGKLATGQGVRPQLIETMDDLAAREGVSRSAIAFAFVLAHPSRPVAIIGTQRPERITEATEALKVHLSRDDVYRLIVASDGAPLP